MLGLRAIARILSGENFFNGCINVGYGVSMYYFSSSGFDFTTLWLFFDPHGTAVSKKYVRLESVSTKCTFFYRISEFNCNNVHLQKQIMVIIFWCKYKTIRCFLHSQ